MGAVDTVLEVATIDRDGKNVKEMLRQRLSTLCQ